MNRSAEDRSGRSGSLDGVNLAHYSRRGTPLTYRADYDFLQPPEVTIFLDYRDEIAGSRALDLGCGAGRAALYLTRWASEYTGLDYSLEMIEHCRLRFPRERFIHGDVRDMSMLDSGAFDLVYFPSNGLDYIDHEGRMLALAEIGRVLSDGGLFIFSSHNRNHPGASRPPSLEFSWDPSVMARNILRHRRRLRNRASNVVLEREEQDYSILNDSAHNYALITYYIGQEAQIRQLASMGFDALDLYSLDGEPLSRGETDRKSGWIYYVARKRRGSIPQDTPGGQAL